MKTILTKSFLISVFFCLPLLVYSLDKGQYIYTLLSSDKFIPTPDCIYKQDCKYVWFGALNGLYRFDGFEYKHYNIIVDGQPTDNMVYKIFSDKYGSLWIMTNKGLGVYNEVKDLFELVFPVNVEDKGVYSCCETDNGFYIGGMNCIFRYNYKEKVLEPFYRFNLPKYFHVKFMGKISDSKIVVSDNENIYSLDLSSLELNKDFIRTDSKISSIFSDMSGHTWVAFYNKGVKAFNADGDNVLYLNKYNSEIGKEAVLCMEQQDSLLWLGTDGGGY